MYAEKMRNAGKVKYPSEFETKIKHIFERLSGD
jgi:hypothetical protein